MMSEGLLNMALSLSLINLSNQSLLPEISQSCIQNNIKQLRWNVLQKYLTAFSL